MDKVIDTNDEWIDYPFNPTRIAVCRDGRIMVKEQLINRKKRGSYISKAKILKQTPNKQTGYIHLGITGEKENLAHRIVALTFISNPDNKPQAHHINHIRHDNRVDNLEWTDNSGNQLYSFKFGNGNNKGEAHPASKITQKIAEEIRLKYKAGGYTYRGLGEEYHLSNTNISDIVNRKIWNYSIHHKKQHKKEYTRNSPPIPLDNEIWYDIPNAPDYKFSNFDRVKSLPRTIRRSNRLLTVVEKILKFNKSKLGVMVVSVMINGKRSGLYLGNYILL